MTCFGSWRRCQRHLLILTATPHSGDEASFHNLLGLLNPEFSQLAGADRRMRVTALRDRLAPLRPAPPPRHRRSGTTGIFPRRETADQPYTPLRALGALL
jgi:hypothetical protein